MRQSSAKPGQVSLNFLGAAALARLLDFLRREHPVKAVDGVACALAGVGADVSRAAVSKWFSRESAPSFSALCALIVAYGPRLLAVIVGPGLAWLDEASVVASRQKLDGQIERLKKDLGLT